MQIWLWYKGHRTSTISLEFIFPTIHSKLTVYSVRFSRPDLSDTILIANLPNSFSVFSVSHFCITFISYCVNSESSTWLTATLLQCLAKYPRPLQLLQMMFLAEQCSLWLVLTNSSNYDLCLAVGLWRRSRVLAFYTLTVDCPRYSINPTPSMQSAYRKYSSTETSLLLFFFWWHPENIWQNHNYLLRATYRKLSTWWFTFWKQKWMSEIRPKIPLWKLTPNSTHRRVAFWWKSC